MGLWGLISYFLPGHCWAMRTTAGLFMAYIIAVRELIQAEVSPEPPGSTLPAKLFAISGAALVHGGSE
jgi:hypothetical protein